MAARRAGGGLAFIPYLTAGYPSLEATVECALALADCGADALELGVPFSDPIADGPVIQHASQEALRRGATLPAVLEAAAAIRRHSDIPLVLMSYLNPVLARGTEWFGARAADCGIDGVLLSDLPPEEEPEVWEALARHGLARVHLIAPTTPAARRRALAAQCTGFVYILSRLGVTGAAAGFAEVLPALIADARAAARVPVAVGFGIAHAAQITDTLRAADAVVVGSALVRIAGRTSGAPAAALRDWCRGFVPALAPQDASA